LKIQIHSFREECINFAVQNSSMQKISFLIFLIPTFLKAQSTIEPKAKKDASEIITHNHARIDNYYWMNQRDSKDVLEYIGQENEVSREYFSGKNKLIETLLSEFENRIDPNEKSAPFHYNGNKFQVNFKEGIDYPIITLITGKTPQVFIDENERAKNRSFYELAEWVPSPNNKLLAMSEDFKGRRNYTISFREFNSTKFSKDKIEETDGSIVWANDNKTVFYVKKDKVTLRSYQVYRHVLGTKQSEDVLVYEEKDEKFDVGIEKSLNNQYILIGSGSSTTDETILIDANNPTQKPMVFLARKKDHKYSIDVHNDGFYILSNHLAPNKKLLFSKEIPARIEDCTELISHSKDVLIENVTALDKFLIVEERTNGLQKITFSNLQDGKKNQLEIKEETYSLSLGFNDDYFASNIYYRYNSLTTPASVYEYNLAISTSTLFHRNELIDKNFSPENYESQRIWVTANDGTKIPVSLVYKKGTVLKNAPCLLYAYGSYGYTIPDHFSATRLSLLDRGFVYALAHIRGGKYMGEDWYENGKFLKKKNTFTDFINVAEYLGMKGYCDGAKIYAQGGSAGGLLMGAVMNMAPYLFKGLVAQVPFVDVVTTMLDETIPLTVGEYEEWGNPNEEEYYYYMLNYSPYDNIHKMDYPHLLITTGYHDSQVQYWEPLKWIAKLREYRTNENLLLLDCNMDAGHGGGSGRSTERLEIAKEFAFILGLEGHY